MVQNFWFKNTFFFLFLLYIIAPKILPIQDKGSYQQSSRSWCMFWNTHYLTIGVNKVKHKLMNKFSCEGNVTMWYNTYNARRYILNNVLISYLFLYHATNQYKLIIVS
jgi:hypothetical protein